MSDHLTAVRNAAKVCARARREDENARKALHAAAKDYDAALDAYFEARDAALEAGESPDKVRAARDDGERNG